MTSRATASVPLPATLGKTVLSQKLPPLSALQY